MEVLVYMVIIIFFQWIYKILYVQLKQVGFEICNSTQNAIVADQFFAIRICDDTQFFLKFKHTQWML